MFPSIPGPAIERTVEACAIAGSPCVLLKVAERSGVAQGPVYPKVPYILTTIRCRNGLTLVLI
jgi:hypothetical protein